MRLSSRRVIIFSSRCHAAPRVLGLLIGAGIVAAGIAGSMHDAAQPQLGADDRLGRCHAGAERAGRHAWEHVVEQELRLLLEVGPDDAGHHGR